MIEKVVQYLRDNYGCSCDEIIRANEICYNHSRLFREYVDSPFFEEELGWKIRYTFTRGDDERFARWLCILFPLDVALYCVRIESFIGEIDTSSFIKDIEDHAPKSAEIFIKTAADFLSLTANREVDDADKEVESLLKYVHNKSETYRLIMRHNTSINRRKDCEYIKSLFSVSPDPLIKIFPLDVAIYSLRIDAKRYGFATPEMWGYDRALAQFARALYEFASQSKRD